MREIALRLPLLLDTHIWIGLINGERKIGTPKFLSLLAQAVSNAKVFVSIISVWEIGMLESKGRISLPYSCLEWVRKALQAPGISLAELTPEIAVESSRLPGKFHGDPADRILVATARSMGATLVTLDKPLLDYCQENHFHAISP